MFAYTVYSAILITTFVDHLSLAFSRLCRRLEIINYVLFSNQFLQKDSWISFHFHIKLDLHFHLKHIRVHFSKIPCYGSSLSFRLQISSATIFVNFSVNPFLVVFQFKNPCNQLIGAGLFNIFITCINFALMRIIGSLYRYINQAGNVLNSHLDYIVI